jgi:phosphoglycerol transferase
MELKSMNNKTTRIEALNCLLLSGVSVFLAWRLSGLMRFDLSTPLVYRGDGIGYLWHIKRVVEGTWFSGTTSNGYPFVSHALDQPGSDFGSFLALQIIDLFTSNVVQTWNVYFITGFALCSLAAYFFLRKISIHPALAFAGAILFAFLPYHLARTSHLFLTWYFVAPIFLWYGFRLYSDSPKLFFAGQKSITRVLHVLVLIGLASFGVYYALFGAAVLGICGIIGTFKWRSSKNLLAAGLVISIISGGVLLNITPNIIHNISAPPNVESPSTTRHPSDSERYALKLTQLLMPKPFHRNDDMAAFSQKYLAFPLVNENVTASLGLIGSLGFLLLLGCLFVFDRQRHLDSRLYLLSLVSIFLLLLTTVGGFSSLFAQLVTPMIRGWNRASVFIGIVAIAALVIACDILIRRYTKKQIFVFPAIAFLIFAVGIWDQTSWACHACIKSLDDEFKRDQAFISQIESSLPEGAAVYQLPYMPFPEVPPLHQLPNMGLMVGYLHSDNIKWSYGNYKGRSGDEFFRALSTQPLQYQLVVARRLGFDAIYIDRRGYADFGQSVETEFTNLLNAQGIVSPSNQQSFFEIVENTAPDVEFGASPEEIMAIARFVRTPGGWVFQQD